MKIGSSQADSPEQIIEYFECIGSSAGKLYEEEKALEKGWKRVRVSRKEKKRTNRKGRPGQWKRSSNWVRLWLTTTAETQFVCSLTSIIASDGRDTRRTKCVFVYMTLVCLQFICEVFVYLKNGNLYLNLFAESSVKWDMSDMIFNANCGSASKTGRKMKYVIKRGWEKEWDGE